jgi:DHA2 family multidrug resistance protein
VTDESLSPGHRWAITVSVMLVTVMQIIDTSVTNVVLPHLQGSLSAGVEEVAWVVTSYLAANAIVIPATGWLSSLFGRRRFFLISTILFTVASFLSGIAPNLEFLIVARVFQGIGGGPIIPMSQAIMWEIFPLRQRGLAMSVWGIGIMMGPIFGPTLGGWIADNGRGAGSSTSTCRSGSPASSWPAPSCSTRRISRSRGASTRSGSC